MDDEQIIQSLERHGGSWKDFFLVGDPPAISRWSPHGNLYGLIIEDDVLWRECIEFLRRHGARRFASPDDATRAFRPALDSKNEGQDGIPEKLDLDAAIKGLREIRRRRRAVLILLALAFPLALVTGHVFGDKGMKCFALLYEKPLKRVPSRVRLGTPP